MNPADGFASVVEVSMVSYALNVIGEDIPIIVTKITTVADSSVGSPLTRLADHGCVVEHGGCRLAATSGNGFRIAILPCSHHPNLSQKDARMVKWGQRSLDWARMTTGKTWPRVSICLVLVVDFLPAFS